VISNDSARSDVAVVSAQPVLGRRLLRQSAGLAIMDFVRLTWRRQQPHQLHDCSMRGDGPAQAEPHEDGHAARADNGRVRLPKELIAIWSA
jgi:hypothetical protein